MIPQHTSLMHIPILASRKRGLRWEGEDCNGTTGAVTVEMRVTDGFDPFDTAIAKVLGVDDRIGSIKSGKDADIVVYDGHPFHYLTKATAVFINGQKTE